MHGTQTKAEEALSKYTLAKLIILFNETDVMANSPELYEVRGWIMDALQGRSTPDSYEKWIETDDTSCLMSR